MSQIHIFRFLKINAMTVYPPTLRYLKGTSNKTYLKANSWSLPPDLILFWCPFFFNLSKSETWTSNLSLVFKLKTFLNSYLYSLSFSLTHTKQSKSCQNLFSKYFLAASISLFLLADNIFSMLECCENVFFFNCLKIIFVTEWNTGHENQI